MWRREWIFQQLKIRRHKRNYWLINEYTRSSEATGPMVIVGRGDKCRWRTSKRRGVFWWGVLYASIILLQSVHYISVRIIWSLYRYNKITLRRCILVGLSLVTLMTRDDRASEIDLSMARWERKNASVCVYRGYISKNLTTLSGPKNVQSTQSTTYLGTFNIAILTTEFLTCHCSCV